MNKHIETLENMAHKERTELIAWNTHENRELAQGMMIGCHMRLEALTAAIADMKRLEWLDRNDALGISIIGPLGDGDTKWELDMSEPGKAYLAPTAREAIDAAMKEGGKA